MDDNQPEPADPTTDPVTALQQTISQMEPDAMCVGFVCLMEWLEPDGSTSMSMLHTPMPVWHMSGVLNHAQNFCEPPVAYVSGECVCGECDDED